MNEPEPYKYPEQEKKAEFSLKEKIGYALVTVLGIGVLVGLGKKVLKKSIAQKSDAQSFTEGNAATNAKLVKMALENDQQFGTDTIALRNILTKLKSKEEIEKISTEYLNQFGTSLYDDLHKELQSSEYREMLAIKAGKPDKVGQVVPFGVMYREWARRLKAGFDKQYSFIPGTDEGAIKAVFNELPTQRDFSNVGFFYHKEFNENLITALKSELEVWEYPDYMKIITNKPKR